jgi:hypothetical protein
MRLTRISPVSAAKVAFLLYGGLGLFIGAIVALASLVGASFGFGQHDGSALLGAVFGVGAVILLPLLYGGFGAIGAMIMAALYNLVAGIVGGLEVTLEPVTPGH